MKKAVQKVVNKFMYGFGICGKCGTENVRFTSKGNLINHNGCRHRTALKPVGFLQASIKK